MEMDDDAKRMLVRYSSDGYMQHGDAAITPFPLIEYLAWAIHQDVTGGDGASVDHAIGFVRRRPLLVTD